MRKVFILMIILFLISSVTSCTLFKKTIDKKNGFSNLIITLKNQIEDEEWEEASETIKDIETSWEKIKPLFQIDIDHDYVNDIEDSIIKLTGYIETENTSEALVTVLELLDTWENIGSM